MKFNKCVRCGCFFTSENDVCPNCEKKDKIDKNSLMDFLNNNDLPKDAKTLSIQSGVSLKNIGRYLKTDEFSFLAKEFNTLPKSTISKTQNKDNGGNGFIRFEI